MEGGIRDYQAREARWEMHRRPLTQHCEPAYTSKEALRWADFSFGSLTQREYTVLIQKVHGRSYSQIAQILGIREECARQVYSRAVRKMRADRKNWDLLS